MSSGLVSVERDGDVTIVDRLRRLATVPGSAGLDASRLLLDSAPKSELEWSDFEHIAEGRDHIERLIQGALLSGTPGVNVLLYGPPGTGKTEFCKVLAERLGVTLYSVGEADDDGDEPSRGERLQELRLAQRLLARDERSLLLFDEMEDLLSEGRAGLSLFGQPFLRRLPEWGLQGVHAPLAGTGAGANALGDERSPCGQPNRASAHDVRAELRPPTTAVRARIWVRQLDHHGIEAEPDEAHALAREFSATPGVAAGATAAARISGGGIDTVRRGVRGLSRVLSCDAPPQGFPTALRSRSDPGRYRPAGARKQLGGERRAALLPLHARAAGDGQERLRPLPRRAT